MVDGVVLPSAAACGAVGAAWAGAGGRGRGPKTQDNTIGIFVDVENRIRLMVGLLGVGFRVLCRAPVPRRGLTRALLPSAKI